MDLIDWIQSYYNLQKIMRPINRWIYWFRIRKWISYNHKMINNLIVLFNFNSWYLILWKIVLHSACDNSNIILVN